MRKMSVLVVMAMLLSVLLAACGGGGAKGTVEDMIKAMEKRNADDLAKTLCSNADVQLSAMAEMFGEISKIEFDDMKYDEVESSDDSATIHVTGTMKMEMELGGETMSEETSIDSDFVLAKQDGDWCIVTSTEN
ncbi:MAG: hypothetical protein JW910_11320 [Anaerolineae bacterium]|nr:hypothetical protein [Anaerolineae bacterium]